MAAEQPAERQPPAPPEAVILHGRAGVIGARRCKPARARKHGRDQALIASDGGGGHPAKARHHAGRLAPGIARNASRRSATRAVKSTLRAAGLPMTTSAMCGGAETRVTRYASRRRRRARLRCTAPRTCRLTAKPTRRGASASRQSTMRDERSIRLPCWNSAWNSAPLVNRSRRLNRPLRPSVVSAPCRAAASGPSARPGSSSARESRVSSLDGGGSAGTCASWFLDSPFFSTLPFDR